jgi:hypothetical protein
MGTISTASSLQSMRAAAHSRRGGAWASASGEPRVPRRSGRGRLGHRSACASGSARWQGRAVHGHAPPRFDPRHRIELRRNRRRSWSRPTGGSLRTASPGRSAHTPYGRGRTGDSRARHVETLPRELVEQVLGEAGWILLMSTAIAANGAGPGLIRRRAGGAGPRPRGLPLASASRWIALNHLEGHACRRC